MDPAVRIRGGKLRGRFSDGIASFKGVPYAAPPFGANRQRAPRRVEPWDGVRDALAFGPKSPQVPYPPGIAEALAEVVGAGEDCLTLNIWTPDLGPARRPVMVWIPGGMFEFHATGGSALYDGSRFARDGVVCVTINYRVGAEGFLYLDDGVANLGLLDQIAALEWVQENVAALGGDPDRVTVFGESAGAMSIATLMSMPRAKGLFRRAIVQSGTGHNVNSPATAARIGRRLAEKLGIPATREAIAAIAPEPLLGAQAQLRHEILAHPDPAVWGEVAASYLPWAPTVDAETVPERPIDRILGGAAADIDLLVGSNTEETRLFFLSDGSIDRIADDDVVKLAAAYGLAEEGLSAYRRAYSGASAGDLFSAIQTDWYWRIPGVRLADANAMRARGSTYMYEFAWRSPQCAGRLGAAHGVEVPFVFDTLGLGTEPLLGPAPPQPLADAMHAAWVAFAANGDCGWPEYEVARRRTMHFDTASRVVEDPMGDVLALWRGVR
jgi:carboxylesterase 2/para-nitrobenzyl esterase